MTVRADYGQWVADLAADPAFQHELDRWQTLADEGRLPVDGGTIGERLERYQQTKGTHDDCEDRMNAADPCPTCGTVDDPGIPGVHLCSGMRRLSKEEQAALEFSPETKARLLAFFDEADRCRNRAAVEARFFVIG